MEDEHEELAERQLDFKLTRLGWLEEAVSFATAIHDSELLSAVVGDNHLRTDDVLYRRIRQARRTLRKQPSVAARETLSSLERLEEEFQPMLHLAFAVHRGVRRKYRKPALAQFSYIMMMEWKEQTLSVD